MIIETINDKSGQEVSFAMHEPVKCAAREESSRAECVQRQMRAVKNAVSTASGVVERNRKAISE